MCGVNHKHTTKKYIQVQLSTVKIFFQNYENVLDQKLIIKLWNVQYATIK